jgi:hypothetical protein
LTTTFEDDQCGNYLGILKAMGLIQGDDNLSQNFPVSIARRWRNKTSNLEIRLNPALQVFTNTNYSRTQSLTEDDQQMPNIQKWFRWRVRNANTDRSKP